MKTRIIFYGMLICFYSLTGYSQEADKTEVDQNNWFIEAGVNIHFFGHENEAYDRNYMNIKNTVGYRLKDNMFAGITLSFSHNRKDFNNERIYHIYFNDLTFVDHFSSKVYDGGGQSGGVSTFIRKNYNLLDKLSLNLDFGIGFFFSNKSKMVMDALDGSLYRSYIKYNGGMTKHISVSGFINYGFVYQFHKNLGLTLRFKGLELVYEKIDVDHHYGLQEIKTTNISLFKNLHEPLVGFIFYF